MYRKYLKTIIDITVALIGLIITFPILLFAAILIVIANRGNPFFFQIRPGKNEKLFKIIKFKTMNDKRDDVGILLPDSLRLTKIGSIIRKTSIDELPQLINVLKGDMSLIGPRPLLPEYLPLYTDKQKKRHLVKPGITGWAQVNGRNMISWEEKFEYDIWYAKSISFWLDLKILLKTIIKVFRSEGISSNGNISVKPFKGK